MIHYFLFTLISSVWVESGLKQKKLYCSMILKNLFYKFCITHSPTHPLKPFLPLTSLSTPPPPNTKLTHLKSICKLLLARRDFWMLGLKIWAQKRVKQYQILQFLCMAVHVIIPCSASHLHTCVLFLFSIIPKEERDDTKYLNRERKEERMRPKKKYFHELSYTEMVKSRTTRLASGLQERAHASGAEFSSYICNIVCSYCL